jgi:anti-anti-sigma factor
VQLKVSYEDRPDGITVVRVESDAQGGGGVLDVHSAPELRQVLVQLTDEGRLILVVELAGIDDVDSTGLGVLVGGLKRVHFKGGTLSLVVTGERMLAILSKTGLTRVFRIHDTESSAVSALVAAYAEESVEQRRAAIEERAREREAREAAGAATRVVLSDQYSYEHLSESITLVKVTVELDVYTCVALREVLVDLVNQGRFFLVVDMTGVDYLDSTGVGVLVGALKRVRAHQGALALVVSADNVLKQFRITGLVKVFPIFRSVHPAVEFLGREDLRAHA